MIKTEKVELHSLCTASFFIYDKKRKRKKGCVLFFLVEKDKYCEKENPPQFVLITVVCNEILI